MTLNRVSVIVSVHNGESTVQSAINSILQQRWHQLELIIVDDCSTDSTPQILHSFRDPRIRIISNGKNLGLTASLNLALKHAKGEYIFRLDADDLALPKRVHEQLSALTTTNADVCFSRGYFTQSDTGSTTVWKERTWSSTLWRSLFENSYGLHSSVAFKRDSVMRLGGYDPYFVRAQDYDLWDRSAQAGLKFAYVKKPLIQYLLHIDGISIRYRVEQETYAREISFRAMNRLLPLAGPKVLHGLRWLFLEREEVCESGCVTAGINQCMALANSFLASNTEVDSGEIWADVASRCIARRQQVTTEKGELLRIGLLSALRSRLPIVLLRVSKAALGASSPATKKAGHAQYVR
jgi:glycosyltransferase involved in cell wall biosynthesis